MPSDTDAPLRVQPLFAAGTPAEVVEDFPAVAEHAVGDELLERGVVLDLVTRPVRQVRRVENRRQISFDVGREALEVPRLMKDGRRDAEDVFGYVGLSMSGAD